MVGVRILTLDIDHNLTEFITALLNEYDVVQIITPRHPNLRKFLPYPINLKPNQVLVRAFKTYKHPKNRRDVNEKEIQNP